MNSSAVLDSFDSRDSANGAGGLCGAMIGNTLTLGGGGGVHFDEALLTTTYSYQPRTVADASR
jgi:hypothetical protein